MSKSKPFTRENYPPNTILESWANCDREIPMTKFFDKLLKPTKKKFKDLYFHFCNDYFEGQKVRDYQIRKLIPDYDHGLAFIDKNDQYCLLYDTYCPKEQIRLQEIIDFAKADIQIEKLKIDKINAYAEFYIEEQRKYHSIHRTYCYCIRINKNTFFGECYKLGTILPNDLLNIIESYTLEEQE